MGLSGISGAQIALVLVVAAAVVIVIGRFELLCLRDLAGTSDVDLRYLTRTGWLGLILVAIPIGGILYLACGRAP